MTIPSDSTNLALEFVTLNDYLYAGGSPDTALHRLVDLAVDSVPGCDWAAVTAWPRGKAPRSLACSSKTALAVDELQYELREGPCMQAAVDSEVVRLGDAADDDRWRALTTAMQNRTPVRAVLSFHLVDRPMRSALNLYAGRSGAFDQDAVTVAALFAAHARVLLIHAASTDAATTLKEALTTSRQIGAAIGILMSAHKITEEHAFDMLRTASQNLNRKLKDIARDVTQTGILPTAAESSYP